LIDFFCFCQIETEKGTAGEQADKNVY